jgi:hypothetical protein
VKRFSPDLKHQPASHRAFVSKMERDQKARQASTHRHHMSWFVVDGAWETTDDEALAQDLARSERLFLEGVAAPEQSRAVPPV